MEGQGGGAARGAGRGGQRALVGSCSQRRLQSGTARCRAAQLAVPLSSLDSKAKECAGAGSLSLLCPALWPLPPHRSINMPPRKLCPAGMSPRHIPASCSMGQATTGAGSGAAMPCGSAIMSHNVIDAWQPQSPPTQAATRHGVWKGGESCQSGGEQPAQGHLGLKRRD